MIASTVKRREIRVAVVEGDVLFRSVLTDLLSQACGFECVRATAVSESTFRQMGLAKPEVILLELASAEYVAQIKALLPTAQILVLTTQEDDARIFEALMAGASGYLLKSTTPAEILNAIADVHRGGSPMSSQMARKFVDHFHKRGRSAGMIEVLSGRELEVIEQLAKGYRYKEIAEALSISVLTVRSHLQRIYDKLHVRSRTEAVVKYLEGRVSI